MASSKRIAGQFAWASASRVGAALLQALLFILAARAVPPAEFGVLAAMLGVTTLLQTIFDMGVQTFTTRERAARGDVGAIATALRFNARTSVLLAVVAAAIIVGAALVVDPAFALMLPLAVWVSAERTADVRLTISFADGDVRGNAINLLSRRALAIVLFLALVFVSVEPLLSYAFAVAIAAIGSSIFANLYVRGRVTAVPDMSYRQLMRASWPYWLNSVATQARNLDSAITAGFAGAVEAGFFSVASRLTSPLRILPTTLSSVLLPNAAKSDGSRADTIALLRLAGLAWTATTALYVALILTAPWFVPLLLGADYAGSVSAVQIVIAGLPFAALISLLSSILQGHGRKHFVATVSTVSVIACLAMVALGSSAWGAEGAAAALTVNFVAQSIAITIGFYIYVWKGTGENT
ncbi:oligosaccharide flippase family protein [Microbacterium sp. VKM Ac-2923]|uniref:oligosaccharide flippase family protein n=1 Tax=Microbacterium sp. VKM Ac-2923 TaxID=2929476 RepID=UPI001FB48528|nr:oligosaccharide flippase family protein [Microbacterium sp. VKM Ac-2923]MCJ1706809.1 oligosaccharide flippase family protein [Microbacterium sp. VKM Ac-2923]